MTAAATTTSVQDTAEPEGEQPSTEAPLRPRVLRLRDPRPPGTTWAPFGQLPSDNQRTLLAGIDPGSLARPAGGPQPGPDRTPVVVAAWLGPPPDGLPDPVGWSGALAQVLAEVLTGRRPVAQLTRWADERVLASLQLSIRRARSGTPRPVPRAEVLAVWLQFPAPLAAEVAATLRLGGRIEAAAFRLEAWYGRWLCTALQLSGVSS